MERGPKGAFLPSRSPAAPWAAMAVAAWVALAAGGVASAGPATPAGAPPRQLFAVEPFANTKWVAALSPLRYGLPALVAERFAQASPLRFAGGPELFARTPPRHARWLVGGAFERQPDWTLAVTVEIRAAASPGEVVSRATKIGPKDEVAVTALRAAAEALAAIPGLGAPVPLAARALAPFGRDPYAFFLYGRAVGAFHGGGGGAARAELAIEVLRRSLLIDPSVPETRRFMAAALLATGKPAPARAMLTYALDLRPDYALAMATLADLDRRAEQPSARERYARLVELDPYDLGARRAYGELLLEAGAHGEAQKQLEAVLAVDPEDARARRHLVLALSSRKQGKELVAQLEQAVRRDPESVDLRMDLGAAYLSLKMNGEAAAAYAEVLRRKPRHAGALKLTADLAREAGDLKKAATYYGKLRAVAPGDPRPVFLLAGAYAESGMLTKAAWLFEVGARYPGMLPEAYSNLGAIYLRQGNARQALWFLSRAAKRRPDRVTLRYNHALALHRLGSHAEALDELHAARALEPADAGLHFLLGVVAVELGREEEARASFATAVELDPKQAAARENLALLKAAPP